MTSTATDQSSAAGDTTTQAVTYTLYGKPQTERQEWFWRGLHTEMDRRGWIDGLPAIAPTADLVADMLAATPYAPDRVLVTLRPTLRHATVELVAPAFIE